MFEKLESLKKRFEEINLRMADPEVAADRNAYQELARERSSLEEVVSAYDRYADLEAQLSDARELLSGEKDPEMTEFLPSPPSRQTARRSALEANSGRPGRVERTRPPFHTALPPAPAGPRPNACRR